MTSQKLGEATYIMFRLIIVCFLLRLAECPWKQLGCSVQQATTTDPPMELTTTSRPLIGTIENPASSCSDIPLDRPSGEYWILTDSTSAPVRVYCDMNRTSCSCNTAGGWTRVANLDMTDTNQNCPDGFELVSRPDPLLRACGKNNNSGCISTIYTTHGMQYSHVCGKVISYQFGRTDGFHRNPRSIDGPYVDGVSLTHGTQSRQHIWTFATAREKIERRAVRSCPCINPTTPNRTLPSFIGNNYFCDSGTNRTDEAIILYADDPLWDGQGCEGVNTCCQFNNPPWFCRELPQPTTDDIELRLCTNVFNEDSPVERVEI